MKKNIEFVSLGPGGKDTVTIGALQKLHDADRIYCFAVNGVSHAGDTIAELGIDAARVVAVDVPMKSDRVSANATYDRLADRIENEYDCGKSIAVATEGDTGVFATTHYVMDRLVERGLPCVQTAGVPSFIAAAALAGLHLVKLQERLLVIPGKTSADEVCELVEGGYNLVIMKLSMAAEAVREAVKRHPEYSYHYFHNVGMPTQEYKKLSPDALDELSFPYFSLMIIQK